MKVFLASLLFLSFSSFSYAQGIIYGKVVSQKDGLPLSGASVYINGSTFGTTTNDVGEFRLAPVNNGFYDIIVSYVGYEISSYRATISSKNLEITFQLNKKPTELRNVLVLSKDARAKWLRIFRTNFLGVTEAAYKSKILNESEILFEDGNSRDSIKAYSLVPLEIVNKELGYKIYFDLLGFFYSPSEGRTYFFGYSRFEELSKKETVPSRYLKNREQYYFGSVLHFFHSLIDGKSVEEGFATMNIRSIETGDSTVLITKPPVSFGRDVNNSSKMRAGFSVNPEYFFSPDTTGGSLVYKLDWKEQLRVTYKKDPYPKKFLMKTVFLQESLPIGVYSDVDMLEAPAFMDKNGSLYNPLAIQLRGYWSYEKMANMLPLDYRPKRSN